MFWLTPASSHDVTCWSYVKKCSPEDYWIVVLHQIIDNLSNWIWQVVFTGLPISIRTPKARSTPPGSLNDGDFVRHWSLAIARVDISFMMPRRPVYVQLLYEGLKRNALKRRTFPLINSKGKWFFMSIFLPILYHIVFDQITTRIPTLCLLDNFVRQWTPSMKFYIIQFCKSTDLVSCNYLQIVFSQMVVGLWTCQNIFWKVLTTRTS